MPGWEESEFPAARKRDIDRCRLPPHAIFKYLQPGLTIEQTLN